MQEALTGICQLSLQQIKLKTNGYNFHLTTIIVVWTVLRELGWTYKFLNYVHTML